MPRRSDHEHQEQTALIKWRDLQSGVFPELRGLFAIPNGGKRNVVTARKMKAEGVTPGVPDLFLAVPRDGYHGLFIEMKYGSNKPTEQQENMIAILKRNGYLVIIAYSWESAKREILFYLGHESDLRD